jgi:hypothetical protein
MDVVMVVPSRRSEVRVHQPDRDMRRILSQFLGKIGA